MEDAADRIWAAFAAHDATADAAKRMLNVRPSVCVCVSACVCV